MTPDEARRNAGAAVAYSPDRGPSEDGTIIRVSADWVHVRYGAGATKATPAYLLTLLPTAEADQ